MNADPAQDSRAVLADHAERGSARGDDPEQGGEDTMGYRAWGLTVLLVAAAAGADPVGVRPYELDWAGRVEDDHPALVDFEGLGAWRVETTDAEADFSASREQQIWGKHVGRLSYRATGRRPEVRLLVEPPRLITNPFDAVTCWVYGNNLQGRDPTTPPVQIAVRFADAKGTDFEVPLTTVNWKEWFLCHRRLVPPLAKRRGPGCTFKGFVVRRGSNREARVLYFDNLAVFSESFPPLEFELRPRRGVSVFPNRDPGLNTGPGSLPFPTRAETILPSNLTPDAEQSVHRDGNDLVFTYEGNDGQLTAIVPAGTCQWDGIRMRWAKRGGWVSPCVGGGVFPVGRDGQPHAPEAITPISATVEGGRAVCRWRITAADQTADVETTCRLWGKNLVLDVAVAEPVIAELRCGGAQGLINPRLVTIPYYKYGPGPRPAVAVSGSADAPLFLAWHIDWTLSNASRPWAANHIADGIVTGNGGTRYTPRTDGRRNPCYERVFVTLTPHFAETLPNIPNPKSPWKHVTGTHLWRAHGASDRAKDLAFWRRCHRFGMTEVVITDHETGWRDGEESFTFRTRTAPGKGGDEGQFRYARALQDELGFVYGPYNNFTDFAPVNEFWNIDMVTRQADGQLQRAWRRCYAPKPSRAVEFCARLAPIIEQKFHFSTAYCDVHTAVTPWGRVDYDARVPGAGTFTAVFYAFGEIMLLQKQAWGGPVYSEGNNHAIYCGLTDGNYAQDQDYRLPENPWLVDFDLDKLHPLCCNFGMGNPGMFYGQHASVGNSPAERTAWLDRFLAATIAFGHTGFLVFEGGYGNALRSYYLLQQLQCRYADTTATQIRYVTADGALIDTDEAVAGGAYRRSQVITRYGSGDTGCTTVVNGHRKDRLMVTLDGRPLDLPPNGFAGWTADGEVEVFSGERDGHRADLVRSPAYVFVDGHGSFTRFPAAAATGIGICRNAGDGSSEIIPYGNSDCGFALNASAAVALDEDGRELGPAELRRARGLTYAMPVKGAFSYRLRLTEALLTPPAALTCARDLVVAGEEVVVHGQSDHRFRIPPDVRPGRRLWQRFKDAWIDFTVVPLARLDATVTPGGALALNITSQLGEDASGQIEAAGISRRVALPANRPVETIIPLSRPRHETIVMLPIRLSVGDLSMTQRRALTATAEHRELVQWPRDWRPGMQLRGGPLRGDFGETRAQVASREVSCGDVAHPALFMHPPYHGGVGRSFARFGPLRLPPETAPCFRAEVGKGDGSDAGDGIVYQLSVIDENDRETLVREQHVIEHAWVAFEADLSRWAGKSIVLVLSADVGPADNSTGDWGCWSGMRVETREREMRWSLANAAGRWQVEDEPFPLAKPEPATLQQATAGRLHYEGMGLAGTGGPYETYAVFNGIELGPMAPAAGDEANGRWAAEVGLPLTPAAVATLGYRNTLRIRNPGRDCFKLRRLWLELTLADGRRVSSAVSVGPFTQPGEWLYAEGVRVPFGTDLAVDLWFRDSPPTNAQ